MSERLPPVNLVTNMIHAAWSDAWEVTIQGYDHFNRGVKTIIERQEFAQKAVNWYRGYAQLYGADKLDEYIRAYAEQPHTDTERLPMNFSEFKVAVADFKKYPLMEVDLPGIPNARHLLKFAPVLAVSSSLIAADAIGDEAKASMGKSRDARKAGNNELADQYQSDVLIHKFRAKLKGSEAVVDAIPSVAFLTAGSLSTAVDAANEALQDITVEGRAKIANNRQLASTFQYLIHNPDKAGTVEYQAQASLVSLRPDILQAVTVIDAMRQQLDPRRPQDVLSMIEIRLSELIADGKQVPHIQQQQTEPQK